MVKALIFSDLQATEGSERCFTDPTLPLQRYRVQKFFTDLWQLYQQHQCTCLWDLGDTTDDRTAIPIPTLDTLAAGLSPFPNNQHNLALIGNHGQYLRNTEMHMGRVLGSKFKIIDNFEIIEIENVVVIATAFPASMTQLAVNLDSAIKKYRNRTTIVLGHWDIQGCRMKSGIQLQGLSVELLDTANLTLCGHIHLPQKLGNNIYYVGSPFQQDFGEASDLKRVAILTINKDQIALEFVPTVNFPEYKTLDLPTLISTFDPQKEDRIQVEIKNSGEAEQYYAWPWANRVKPLYVYDSLKESVSNEPQKHKDWTLNTAVRRWTELNEPSKAGITVNTEELIAFGEDIALNGS